MKSKNLRNNLLQLIFAASINYDNQVIKAANPIAKENEER